MHVVQMHRLQSAGFSSHGGERDKKVADNRVITFYTNYVKTLHGLKEYSNVIFGGVTRKDCRLVSWYMEGCLRMGFLSDDTSTRQLPRCRRPLLKPPLSWAQISADLRIMPCSRCCGRAPG